MKPFTKGIQMLKTHWQNQKYQSNSFVVYKGNNLKKRQNHSLKLFILNPNLEQLRRTICLGEYALRENVSAD